MIPNKADVIIPFLNYDELLNNCISSLIKEKCIENIFLVQNGVDKSNYIMAKKSFEEFISSFNLNKLLKHIVIERKNTSLALNIGIKESKNKYVMFASSHSYFEKGYIDQLLKKISEDNNIYAIGGRVVCVPGTKSNKSIAVRDAFSSYLGCFSRYRSLKISKKIYKTNRPYSALYRKSALENIGYFDESKERAQDIDTAKRLIESGGLSIIYPIKNVYWVLKINTPIDIYKRYLNQGYWTVRYNIGQRNFFIFTSIISLIILTVFLSGKILLFFFSLIILLLSLYSFLISSKKMNAPIVALSLVCAYAGYFFGIIKALLK